MFNSLWQKTFKGELINLNNLEDYKNYTVTQLKDTINNNPYAPMSELYRLVWEKENTLSHAIGLVRSLRKEKKFDIGKEFHDKFQKRYPDTKQLESERLWFIFSSKVCNSSNDSYIDDADNLLKLCSQDDPRTNLIFEVTTLFTSSRLIKDKKYSEAYQWLSKLNPNLLSPEGRTNDNGDYYTSNKKRFYTLKADALIGMDKVSFYLNWAYTALNFSKEKKDEFIDEIISRSTFNREVWGWKLGEYLYDLDRELVIKGALTKPVLEKRDYILASELSQYLFCPASYAINRSYNIPRPVSIDPAIWEGSKDGFLVKYNQYQTARDIDASFKNFDNITDSVKQEFEDLFKTKILTNNTIDNNPSSFRSDNRGIVGAPDFILESSNGEKILLMEKFSSSGASGINKVYDADIIEIEAYLTKFKSLNISVGYFVNWVWGIDTAEPDGSGRNTNIIKMVSVTIKKLSLADCRENYVDLTVKKITNLLKNVQLPASNIGFVNKCFHCSVSEFCCHKSGELEHLTLPYEMKPLSL